MSCVTENTIVIKSVDAQIFMNAVCDNRKRYGWINNLQKVYQNEELIIITFDCNGEPFSIEEQVEFLVMEMNCLDGEPMYTQLRDPKTNKVTDVRYRAQHWIKKLIGSEAFDEIKTNLVYSDGRI